MRRLSLRLGGAVALCALGSAAPGQSGAPALTDVTAEWGVDFVHFNGMSGRFYYPEVVGAGAALFDMDGDGDLDLFLVQGAMLGPDRDLGDALLPYRGPLPPRDRLLRNELAESGTVRFTDVTEQSGLSSEGYGMGVATGDVDNDGDVDLYVTNFGANQLWRNRGGGRFENVTAAAGVGDPGWSSSASFWDYDADGDLDLMVANYLEFSYAVHRVCTTERGEPDYCLPRSYRPAANRLYRNRGDGSFEDVSVASGIAAALGNSLGVVAADFNGDGRLDIYVANDLTPNSLLLNQGDGGFVDDGMLSGAALNADGMAEASMGVDAADFDGDGDEDLFMTHFSRESNTLYLNEGQGFFRDASDESGLATPSWQHTAFGTAFVDVDLDGLLDLVVANGGVTFPPGSDRQADPYPLDEPNQIFRNVGGGRFQEIDLPVLEVSEVSRGIVVGDIDNDGDADIVVTNNSGPARLWRNDAAAALPWVGLRLLTADGRRDALGALAAIARRGEAVVLRRSRTDGSYASAHDPRVLVALAGDANAVDVTIRWPDGVDERFEAVPTGRYTALRQGAGKPR